MNRSRVTAALGCCLVLVGCAAQDDPDVAQIRSEIVNGTTSSSYPQIGKVWGGTESCTGTLVGQFWVITAAHCVGYQTTGLSSYSFSKGESDAYANGPGISVDRIANLGNTCVNGSTQCRTTPNTTISPDRKGNNDIALLHLTSAPAVTALPL